MSGAILDCSIVKKRAVARCLLSQWANTRRRISGQYGEYLFRQAKCASGWKYSRVPEQASLMETARRAV